MPVYIFREGTSNIFKIGLTRSEDVNSRRAQLQTGNSVRLIPFDCIDTEHLSACEAFFHRLLPTRRVPGGGRDFFRMDSEEHMRATIEQFREMNERLQNARSNVQELSKSESTTTLLSPTREDEALFARLLEIRQEQEYLHFERELIECQLKSRIGRAAGIKGIATWKSQVSRMYSEEIFRNADPERYQEVLERYYCLDVKTWKAQRPDEYSEIQKTYYVPRISRPLKLRGDLS